MVSDAPKNKNNNPLQRLSNGSAQKPLQRLPNGKLYPSEIEIRIEKCKKNIVFLKHSTTGKAYSAYNKQLLLTYYRQRLTYYQNQLDTSHAWLIDVSSPNPL